MSANTAQTREEKKSVFDERFVGRYPQSKTLGFSLIPVLTESQKAFILEEKGYSDKEQITRQDRMERFFLDNKKSVFDVDKKRKDQYGDLKKYLTELHKVFIKDALVLAKSTYKKEFSKEFALNYDEYMRYFQTKNEEQKSAIAKKINSKKEEIAKLFIGKKGKKGIFQETAKKYFLDLQSSLREGEKIKWSANEKKGFEKGSKNILLSPKNVLFLLRKKVEEGVISDEEDKFSELFSDFQKWTTYFRNFSEIRGNLYKDDGRTEGEDSADKRTIIQKGNANQITTRIIDENFEIFVRNAFFCKKNSSSLGLHGGYEGNDCVEIFGEKRSILNSDFYVNCFLQTDINIYNEAISRLNKFFNEKRRGKQSIEYLEKLTKQLLLTDGLEEKVVKRFFSEAEFIEGLQFFHRHAKEKVAMVQNFLVDGEINCNFEDVLLNENQTHFFCNVFFGSWSYLRDLYRRRNSIGEVSEEGKNDELKTVEGISKKTFSLLEIQELLEGETKESFEESLQSWRSWFDFQEISERGVYRKEKSNFENFLSLLGFYLHSFIDGRGILSKREKKDKERINRDRKEIEEKGRNGERVDDLLLSKFSPEIFEENIRENIEEKEKRFIGAMGHFASRKKLSRKELFATTNAINEYCSRVSDINRFFALFEIPEGVSSSGIIQEFKERNEIVSSFGAIKNFITAKESEKDKIKLNFENQFLLDGWDVGKETERKSFIFFQKEGKMIRKFFLGVVSFLGDKKMFEKNLHPEVFIEDEASYKMEYKFFKDASMMIPKCSTQLGVVKRFFLDSVNQEIVVERGKTVKKDSKIVNPLKITREIFELNNFGFEKKYLKTLQERMVKPNPSLKVKIDKNRSEDFVKTFQKNYLKMTGDEAGYRKSLNTWIDFCKEFLNSYESTLIFSFDFKPTNEYKSVDEFYRDVNIKTYDVKILPVSGDFIQKMVESGKLFLFEIYSKDFSPYKNGGEKSEEERESNKNLHTLYFEELFSEENQKFPIFKLSGGGEIFFREKIEDYKQESWEKQELRKPKTNKIPLKKRRFTKDAILLKLSIVQNHISKNNENINRDVQRCVVENKDLHVLGLDRGEKHLAYACLLDGNGYIAEEPRSLNEIRGIDYMKKLDLREKERMMARRSWTKIENIKELKKGYISNVTSDLARTLISKSALICLENLNYLFKKDRSTRIEKGVYQYFEDALADKLRYAVLDKTAKGVRNALQLVPPQMGTKKMTGNQSGVMLYVDARHTSKTCPHCGFRSRGGNFEKEKYVRDQIKKGNLAIFYEKTKDRFRIEYDWDTGLGKDLYGNEKLYGKGVKEYIYSDVERKDWNHDGLIRLFERHLEEGENVDLFRLVSQERSFSYVTFGKIFTSLTWIRRSIPLNGEKEDRISCPKCHFSTSSSRVKNIKNGDANGAYNIARKGLIVLRKIRSEKLKKKIDKGIPSSDLKISLFEWDCETYAQWLREGKKDWEESDNLRGL